MKNTIKYIILATALLCGSVYTTAIANDKAEAFTIEYRIPDVPEKMTFAGESIDLTRYDMYERVERELTTACYMHATTMLTIKRANRYMPIIVPILEREKIPTDFIYLVAIESAFNPLAKSPAKAAGMWQFMPTTAREYGLEVNNDIDERYNIEKATVAACRYLHDAYEKYGSWVDAAVSYNAGLQRVARERERQGVKSSLDMHLVDETSRYVFRILATKLLFENPAKYGFKIKAKQLYQPIATKTIEVTSTIDDLATWAQKQGITYKQLKDFNPWMLTQTLPDKSGKLYKIAIPIKEDMYYNAKRKYVTYNKNWVVD
jgi:hypothetical protein